MRGFQKTCHIVWIITFWLFETVHGIKDSGFLSFTHSIMLKTIMIHAAEYGSNAKRINKRPNVVCR